LTLAGTAGAFKATFKPTCLLSFFHEGPVLHNLLRAKTKRRRLFQPKRFCRLARSVVTRDTEIAKFSIGSCHKLTRAARPPSPRCNQFDEETRAYFWLSFVHP
jgi:hypothetical protein